MGGACTYTRYLVFKGGLSKLILWKNVFVSLNFFFFFGGGEGG